jgi:hypothetical protein
MNYFYSIYAYLGFLVSFSWWVCWPKWKEYRRLRSIETIGSIFLASIDTFLQNPGINSIEYLVSILAHPYRLLVLGEQAVPRSSCLLLFKDWLPQQQKMRLHQGRIQYWRLEGQLGPQPDRTQACYLRWWFGTGPYSIFYFYICHSSRLGPCGGIYRNSTAIEPLHQLGHLTSVVSVSEACFHSEIKNFHYYRKIRLPS